MSDLLRNGVVALASRVKAGASQAVTYHRGSDEVEIQATLGRFSQTFDAFGGTLLANDDLDFIVTAADLVIDDAAIEPRNADWIEYGGYRHEVCRPDGQQRPPFERDAFGVMYRIHTKRGGAV